MSRVVRTGKRWLRGALELLPKAPRHSIYRQMLRFHREPPNLSLSIARTKEELESAFTLLHDAYVEMGFMQPHPSGMRVTAYHALPTTATLIARWDEEVIGTVSIVRDTALGLPADQAFDLSALRAEGTTLAEVSALAIKRQYHGDSGQALFPLLKFMYQYSERYLGVTCIVIATHPGRAQFYEAVFGFDPVNRRPLDHYDFANGAPAEGWYLDYRDAHRKWIAMFGGRAPEKNLFTYFTDSGSAHFLYPDRRYFTVADPVMTPELFDYFFNVRTDLFAKLSEREQDTIMMLYDGERRTPRSRTA